MKSLMAMAAALMLVSGAAAAQTEPAAERVTFDPLWLGMSFDDARAAAPMVDWQETTLIFNPGQRILVGEDVVTVLGRSFNARVEPGVYGAAWLTLDTEEGEIGLRACRAAAVEMTAAMEARFGAFAAQPPAEYRSADAPRDNDWDSMSASLPGYLTTGRDERPREVLRAGQASRVAFSVPSFGRSGRGSWQAIRLPQGDDALTVGVGAVYALNPDSDRLSCSLSIHVRRLPPRPEQETIAFETLVPVVEPTLADRHASLEFMTAEQLAALPAEGVDVSVECIVRRHNGTLLCLNPDEIAPDERHLISAAQVWGYSYQFRTDNLEPASDIPLRTLMTVRLKPSDRVDLSSPPEGELLAMGALKWRRFIGREWLNEQMQQLASGDVSLRARCQVQVDGSVICEDMAFVQDGAPYAGRDVHRLSSISRAIASVMSVAPELEDGTASAGRWFNFALTLRVPD